jgi:hypothetical protein
MLVASSMLLTLLNYKKVLCATKSILETKYNKQNIAKKTFYVVKRKFGEVLRARSSVIR